MAKLSLLNAKAYVAQFDLSGDVNAIALQYAADTPDVTNFGSGGTRERIGGLKTVDMQLEGFWDGATDRVDQAMFPKVGLADQLITVAPDTAAEGARAFAFLSAISKYAPGALVGEAFKFSLSGEASSSPLVGGAILHNATRTANGNGTAIGLGAQPAGRRIFLGVHLLALTGGGALDVALDSDDNAGMSSPTLSIVGTGPQSTVGGFLAVQPTLQPGSETWWRVRWVLTGTTPSATFLAFLGFAQ